MWKTPIRRAVRPVLDRLRSAPCRVSRHASVHTCPICAGGPAAFLAYGTSSRSNARCPSCGSLERHRLLWLFLQRKTNFFDGRRKRVLHVAPEAVFEPRFATVPGIAYHTADLHDPHAMERMDVTDIRHPPGTFDVIFCSHVLEHVEDDRRAMREFHRVLADDGWAILLVPITAEHTFEDPSVTDPHERLRLFGQSDHVRRYGPDYVERLRDAGFTVALRTAGDVLLPGEAQRHAIPTAIAPVYFCTKRSNA
jgi:SAM-dependent methyltransferase